RCGKPDGILASPPEPRVQGRSAGIGMAEDVFPIRGRRPGTAGGGSLPRQGRRGDNDGHARCDSFPMTPERGSLRRIMRERRRALPPAERIAAAEMLAGRLLALPFAPTHGYVAG